MRNLMSYYDTLQNGTLRPPGADRPDVTSEPKSLARKREPGRNNAGSRRRAIEWPYEPDAAGRRGAEARPTSRSAQVLLGDLGSPTRREGLDVQPDDLLDGTLEAGPQR